MKDAYRVRLSRPRGRYRAYGCLVLGALLLYGSTFLRNVPSMRVESRAAVGALLTREEELPGTEYYCVSLAESESEAAAQAEASAYVSRGAAGLVVFENGLYRAIGACYETEAEAETAAAKLRKAGEAEAAVFRLRAPGVSIRVTATEEQLHALLDADEAARKGVWRIDKIARAIDAGETDSLGARGALFTAAAELREAREELTRLTEGESVPATEALVSLLEDSEAELDALSRASAQSRTELSGLARLAQARLITGLRAYREGLGL